MGLLSFLSRKNHADKGQQDTLFISQAYHSTTASVAPVKGTLPVGGNGKTDLETLTKARGLNHSQPLSSSHPAPDHDEPAPAPAVPLLPSDIEERPGTAPSRESLTAAATRLKSTPSTSHHSLRPSRRHSLVAEPRSLSSAAFSKPGLSGLREAPRPTLPQSISLHAASGRGFKDLLDAQSEFKPLDFKTRVKAAGARDYGEDVADRNMRENGCDTESTETQSCYSQSFVEDASLKTRSLRRLSQPYRVDRNHLLGQLSLGSGSRATSLKLSSPLSNTKRHSYRLSRVPSGAKSDTPHSSDWRPQPANVISLRRQSLGRTGRTNYIQGSTRRSSTASPNRGSDAPWSGLPLRLATHFPELLSDSESDEASSPEHGPDSPTVLHPPNNRSSASTIRPSKSTDEKPGQRLFPLITMSKPDSRPLSSMIPPGARTQMHPLTPPRTPRSLRSFDTSASGYHSARETTPEGRRSHWRRAGRSSRPANFGHLTISTPEPSDDADENGDDDDTDAAPPPPCIRTAPGSEPFPRYTDPTPTPTPIPSSAPVVRNPRAVIEDQHLFEGSVPPRSSSIRKWSVSSSSSLTAPTTAATTAPSVSSRSNSNSKPYAHQRPASRHTAQTSVDLDPASLSPKQHHHHHHDDNDSKTFNMDDYLSSDDDDNDPIAPRRPRGEGEENLLFCPDGYGGGSQLPGLFDALSPPPPRRGQPGGPGGGGDEFLLVPRVEACGARPAFGEPGYFDEMPWPVVRGGGGGRKTRRRRRSGRRRTFAQHDSAADSEEEEREKREDEEEEEGEEEDDVFNDEGRYVAAAAANKDALSPPLRKWITRLSAFGPPAIEEGEEDERAGEEVVARTDYEAREALRARKEAKARKRAMAAGVERRRQKETSSRKESDEADRGGCYEEEQHADVEC